MRTRYNLGWVRGRRSIFPATVQGGNTRYRLWMSQNYVKVVTIMPHNDSEILLPPNLTCVHRLLRVAVYSFLNPICLGVDVFCITWSSIVPRTRFRNLATVYMKYEIFGGNRSMRFERYSRNYIFQSKVSLERVGQSRIGRKEGFGQFTIIFIATKPLFESNSCSMLLSFLSPIVSSHYITLNTFL